jgi:hypothetical protein
VWVLESAPFGEGGSARSMCVCVCGGGGVVVVLMSDAGSHNLHPSVKAFENVDQPTRRQKAITPRLD